MKGWSANYQCLGAGDLTAIQATPISVNISNVVQASSGPSYTLALLNDGTVKSWGGNVYGELGNNNYSGFVTTPTVIAGLNNVKQLTTFEYSNLALLNDGTVKSWGYNGYGQLGNGNISNSHIPTTIAGLNGVVQVAVSCCASYALMSDGTVKSWGRNNNGQLGYGNNTNSLTPKIIPNLNDIKKIYVSSDRVFFLKYDGTVYGCGRNANGQLGDGTFTNVLSPKLINIF